MRLSNLFVFASCAVQLTQRLSYPFENGACPRQQISRLPRELG